MAWDTELVDKLRMIINDLDSSNYTWTDTQLKKFILISLGFLDSELSQWTTVTGGPFTLDYTNLTITPDPTSSSSPLTNDGFENLVVFRAAMIIAKSDLKKLSSTAGWKIVDDKSTLDGTNALNYAKESANYFENSFKDALKEFKIGNTTVAEAILSPYSPYMGTAYFGARTWRD